MDLDKTEILGLVKADQNLLDEVVDYVVADPVMLEDLAKEVADKLSDALEDDPTFKQKIMKLALTSDDLRSLVIKRLIKDMG